MFLLAPKCLQRSSDSLGDVFISAGGVSSLEAIPLSFMWKADGVWVHSYRMLKI